MTLETEKPTDQPIPAIAQRLSGVVLDASDLGLRELIGDGPQYLVRGEVWSQYSSTRPNGLQIYIASWSLQIVDIDTGLIVKASLNETNHNATKVANRNERRAAEGSIDKAARLIGKAVEGAFEGN